MNIGITVYSTYGGSGIVGSELGKELTAAVKLLYESEVFKGLGVSVAEE